MTISEEDKKCLIEELNKVLGEKPRFLLKFCSKEEYAEDIVNGNLYANTAKHFREQEEKSGERGQGDKYELLSKIKTERAIIEDSRNGEILLTAPTGELTIQFKNDDLIPIVSFVGIDLKDMIILEADENCAKFEFPFTDEEYSKMEDKFGEYCVIINYLELENNIKKYCDGIGCDYIFDKVEYCSQNRIDRMMAFNRCAKERFLYKNDDLKYQREYRLAIPIEIPNDHYIRIGKLNNCIIVKSEKLKDLSFNIEYTSYLKE